MPRLRRNYTPRQLTSAFENKLNLAFRSGKHRSGTYHLPDGQSLFSVTLPKAHRNWSRGVQRDLLRATKLTPEEFDNLVRCPMTGPQFAAHARELFAAD